MICEICKAEGKKSEIRHWTTTESTNSDSSHYYFYDEDGRYHSHSERIFKTNYHCTNQHFFDVISRQHSCLVAGCEHSAIDASGQIKEDDDVVGNYVNRTATSFAVQSLRNVLRSIPNVDCSAEDKSDV